MPAPNVQLIDSAANYVVTAHRLRIRFLHLLYCLLDPEFNTRMGESYSPELIAHIKAKSLTMYGMFRVAGHEFSQLDTVKGWRKWMAVYKRAEERFDEGVALLREFESKADNLAVEWQAVAECPVKEVPVGSWYGDLEGPLDEGKE
jgi:hypothetical protein